MPRTIPLNALDLSRLVRQGDMLCWGQAQAEPLGLTERLMQQRHAIGGVRAFVGIGWFETIDPANADAVDFMSYCGTGRNRLLHAAGKLDILPVHYSRFHQALAGRIDVLLLHLAPGRRPGTYSLALACEYLWPLVRTARLVIGEVNDQAPSTPGAVELLDEDIDIVVPTSRQIPDPPAVDASEAVRAIGAHVAGIVRDGATLQVGLGAIPAAILDSLHAHRRLGAHTGLFVDGFTRLIGSGAMDNSAKRLDAGYCVAGLIVGDAHTRAMCNDTDLVRLAPTSYTHSREVLSRVGRFTSINTALEIDLTGQINAETAGGRYVGAIGGATDFTCGAAACEDGLPIIALQACRRDRHGALASNIVPSLSGPVSIGRADAALVVTEHGVADLRGASLRERRQRLLAIAEPQLREAIERDAALST